MQPTQKTACHMAHCHPIWGHAGHGDISGTAYYSRVVISLLKKWKKTALILIIADIQFL